VVRILPLMLLMTMALLGAAASIADDGGCTGCHTASADKPVHAILQTPHGRIKGGGNAACTSCHGESEAHAGNPSQEAPTTSFGPRWALPAEGSNAACLSCHQGEQQMFWNGSVHETEDTACTDCHQLHRNQDPVLTADGELSTCLTCHTKVQAEIRLPSRHPIVEGKTSCSDCHNPHGSSSDFALLAPTLNDSCYGCHAEKRGPHLWEHPPAAEDCSLCHRPHGSVNERLLTSRAPFLCQQCHSAAFHPSQLNSGATAGNRSSNQNLLGKNCLNCHSQVHGSNHPSGARLTR
jgi:DmsE family decaheme c-type cytochrome